MIDGPYPLALAAGMVAALNPCGFALLPAYLTMLIVDSDDTRRVWAVGRALRMSAAMTAGFVAVFGAFAAVAVPLALSVERFLPWATIVIGVLLVGLGIRLVTGGELMLSLPRLGGGAPDRTVRSMAAYGVVYAVASLSCTVGPFLAIVTSTSLAGSLVDGFLVLVAYALGMGLVVGLLAVAVALTKEGVVGAVRRLLPHINRISGVLLIVAGAYVAYFGWYELRVFAGGSTDDPIIDAAARIQGTLASWVTTAGAWWLLAGLGALAAVGWWMARRTSRVKL